MSRFTDQMGRTIDIPHPPRRIISLVPSQTELLFDFGLSDEVAGITKFCIHPEIWFRSKPRIGGTKQIDFSKVDELKPDLVIGNKEENEITQVQELMNRYPVWMSDIRSFADALEMIGLVGDLTGRQIQADDLGRKIADHFSHLEKDLSPVPLRTAAYLIWNDPMMTVGRDTFIHDMMKKCRFQNVFSDYSRYPEIKKADLQSANPEFILLSSEPYPFKEKHIRLFGNICPQSQVLLVDGELFSWYGSRMLQSPDYFRTLAEQMSARS